MSYNRVGESPFSSYQPSWLSTFLQDRGAGLSWYELQGRLLAHRRSHDSPDFPLERIWLRKPLTWLIQIPLGTTVGPW